MSQFFANLLLFWLQALGLIVFVALGLAFILGAVSKLKERQQKGALIIENITQDFDAQCRALQAEILSKKERKALQKQKKKAAKAKKDMPKSKLFVLEFKGDLQAHEAECLAESVTALLQIAQPADQVLLKLQSPGGAVQGYGFAAAQLSRIRDHGLKLTVAVDQVAASGGYLMAVVADEIIASPFAILGSIGVIAQIPNFHRFLKEKGIDFEQVTAGNYKRTLTMFGENTAKDRKKLQEQLEDIHTQFKHFIQEYRPQINLAEVATGEFWLAKQALAMKLLDKIQVSDDFILSLYQQDYQIFKLKYVRKKKVSDKFGSFLRQAGLNFLTDRSHIGTSL